MDAVVAIRRSRKKPVAVYLQLVDSLPDESRAKVSGMEHTGIVTVLVTPQESLGSIDFRPLKGLMVCVEDHAGDRARLQELAVHVSKVEPDTLWMPDITEQHFALHIRRGDPLTSETHVL